MKRIIIQKIIGYKHDPKLNPVELTPSDSWHGKEFRSQHKIRKQHASPKKGSVEKSHIGQGRSGLRRRRMDPINQTIISPSKLSQKILGETKDGNPGNACLHQAELTLCFSDQVLVLLCLPRSIKGKCLLGYA